MRENAALLQTHRCLRIINKDKHNSVLKWNFLKIEAVFLTKKGKLEKWLVDYLKNEQQMHRFDELMICTIPCAQDFKLKEYELLAKAFDLKIPKIPFLE